MLQRALPDDNNNNNDNNNNDNNNNNNNNIFPRVLLFVIPSEWLQFLFIVILIACNELILTD